MKKLGLYVQVATLISVVVGAALVLAELRQSHGLARAQFAGEIRSLINERRFALFGEQLALSLERSCFEPHMANRQDRFLLNEYFETLLSVAIGFKTSASLGGFDTDWRSLSRGPLQNIHGYPQGEKWLLAHPFPDAELAAVIREAISNPSARPCDAFAHTLSVPEDDA